MASTTSKKQNADVVGNKKAASNAEKQTGAAKTTGNSDVKNEEKETKAAEPTKTTESTESTEPNADAEQGTVAAASNAEKQTDENQNGGNQIEENKSGLPFTVKDGLVEVVSKKRAGKSVYGATGKIVTFDADGKATVELADALHFKNVPGFEFK